MIETIFIIALFCNGLYLATEEGNLLDFLIKPIDKLEAKVKKTYSRGGFSEEQLNNALERKIYWWSNPLITCIKCMASVWGTIIYLVLLPELKDFVLTDWLIVIVSSVFFNYIVWLCLRVLKRMA